MWDTESIADEKHSSRQLDERSVSFTGWFSSEEVMGK